MPKTKNDGALSEKITGKLTGKQAAPDYDLEMSITLRDFFAAAAFSAVISAHYSHSTTHPGNTAEQAYKLADAMLAHRAKGQD